MSNKYVNINDVVHWVVIVVHKKDWGGEIIDSLKWDNIPWNVRQKWSWYFIYRAALLQIKYPHSLIEHRWGNKPATGKFLDQILKNKISRKKAKVTEIKNKLKLAIEHWDYLFPIKDDILYKKALIKLNRISKELEELLNTKIN